MTHVNGQGQEIDIAKLFYRLTLDSATDYLSGESVNSLENPKTEFTSASAKVQRGEYPSSIDGPVANLRTPESDMLRLWRHTMNLDVVLKPDTYPRRP